MNFFISKNYIPVSGINILSLILQRTLDGYYWDGEEWKVDVQTPSAVEYDAVNFPGLYTYTDPTFVSGDLNVRTSYTDDEGIVRTSIDVFTPTLDELQAGIDTISADVSGVTSSLSSMNTTVNDIHTDVNHISVSGVPMSGVIIPYSKFMKLSFFNS